MKLLGIIVGFLLAAFLTNAAKGDISLTLKNKPYLPPPVQEQQQEHQQKIFKESNYGNNRYQIFEVHNHYEPSTGNGKNTQNTTPVETNYITNSTTPKTEKNRTEHINAPANFPFDAPDLDAFYLGLAGEGETQQEIIMRHELKSEKSFTNTIPIPFPSYHHHHFPEKSYEKVTDGNLVENSEKPYQSQQQSNQQSREQYSQQQKAVSQFKGSDYLPPKSFQEYTRQPQQNFITPIPINSAVKQNQHSNVQQPISSSQQHASLTAQHQQHQSTLSSQQNLAQNAKFKGPEYLPPHQYQQHYRDTSYSQQNLARNSSFKGADYLLPHQPQRQQNQHQSALKPELNLAQSTAFKGADYLPPYQDQQQQQGILQSQQNLATNSLFKAPDYMPPHQKKTELERVLHYQQNFAQNPTFKGPDYLPPHHNQQLVQQTQQTIAPNTIFKDSFYLSPYQQPQQSIIHTNSRSIIPGHLPHHQQQQPNQVYRSSATITEPHHTPFNGFNYLLPSQKQEKSTQLEPHNALKGPGYLAPQAEDRNNNAAFKGSDYLPPIQYQGSQQQPGQVQQSENLPIGYEFQKPIDAEQAIAKLHTLPADQSNPPRVNVQSQMQVSGHEQSGDIIYGTFKQIAHPQNERTYHAPAYLPPDYVSIKPENFEKATQQLHSQVINATVGQNYNQLQSSQLVQQLHLDVSNGVSIISETLPVGYNFPKSSNAEEALIQSNDRLKSYQSVQSNQIGQAGQNCGLQAIQTYQQSNNIQPSQTNQQFKAPSYLPPATGPQTFVDPEEQSPKTTASQTSSQMQNVISNTVSQNFKGPGSGSPPSKGLKAFKVRDNLTSTTTGSQSYKVSSQSATSASHQQYSQVFKVPDYLPPVDGKQPIKQTQFKGPGYLPPPTVATTGHGLQPTVFYPLSSYMTNVKPNDRYANERKPFPEYGLPPTTTISEANSINVSPMFNEPGTRPPHYAPSMSYTTYTTKNQNQATSALNRQTQETLQTFMPQEIRQQQTHVSYALPIQRTFTATQTTVPVIQPTSSKIRTVQIFNLNAIKTFKILESLDHSGVKTIKILGPSQEEPMGEHRVIKVVGSGHDQNVQTLKIFNDQQDATPLTVQQSSQSNVYLPARRKRNTFQKSNVKSSSRK